MEYSESFRLGMDSVDAFGIVYFGRYWDWYEQAFEGLLAAAGHPLEVMLERGVGLPVVHADLDYRKAIRLGDHVTATVTLERVGTRSVTFAATFDDQDGNVTAEGTVIHAYSAIGMGPADAPDWLRALAREPAET